MHECTGGKKRLLSLAAEQELARELIESYKQRMSGDGKGRYGANKIVEDIYSVIGGSSTWTLSGDDLKHWLEGRTIRLGDSKFQPIKDFILSAEFVRVVPEAKQKFDSVARMIEIGCSIAQINGYDLDSKEGVERLGLDGIWMLSPHFTEYLVTDIDESATDFDRSSRMVGLFNYILGVDAFACIHSIPGYGFSVAHFVEGNKEPYDGRPRFRLPSVDSVKASGYLFQRSSDCIDGLIWDRKTRHEYRCYITPNPYGGVAPFVLRPKNGYKGFIRDADVPLFGFKIPEFFERFEKYLPTELVDVYVEHIYTSKIHLLDDWLSMEKALNKMFDKLRLSVIPEC